MKLALLHRRLTVGMGLAGLLAFAAGAGFEPLSALVAGAALVLALFWRPSGLLADRLEHLWLPLALLLVARALWHVVAVGDDVVIPVVDLLLLLLCAEALRSLDSPNDQRLYALSAALLLAATAYRPGAVFAVALVLFVALATLALMVGHVRRQALRHGIREVSLDRSLLGTTSALSAAILLTSAVVFFTFPRASRGWSGRGEVFATSVAGFSDEVSLGNHGARIYPNPQVVLRVEFPDGRPDGLLRLHWRGRSYDRFDGVRWSRSRYVRPSSGLPAWYRSRWPRARIRQDIWGARLDSDVLFALHPVLDVGADSRIQPLFDNVGDHYYWGSVEPRYSVTSVAGRPTAEQLRAATDGFVPDPQHYLQLPELPRRIHDLADSITAGATNRYDRTAAVETWLRTRLGYTLELPRSAREATLDHFLFERREGHCEYFSTAMVVLLRSLGIQARNVNGFLGGRWNDFGGYLAVTQNEAHSWVEVWFPGYGWVPFDPTPSGGGGAAGSDGWFWPGRIFFDGIQHRWSKWVLDYDTGRQTAALRRMFGFLDEPDERPAEGGSPAARPSFWPLALFALLAGIVLVLVRRVRRHPPHTRAYLELLRLCRRRGLVGDGPVGPLEVLARLEAAGHPARGPARRVVEGYLPARFAGRPPGPEAAGDLRRALAEARRAFRRHRG